MIGLGAVLVSAHTDATTGAAVPAEPTRLAYPQRPPGDYLPRRSVVDDLLPSDEVRAAVSRRQIRRDLQAAAARESAAVRARALELTVKPQRAAAPAAAPAATRAAAPARVQAPARSPVPALAPGTQLQVTVSFYYCAPGPSGRRVGDGGGFCGAMRNGQVVHSGAAACAGAYLGQRFRIVGDPTGRTYTCADTGSAVHGQHRDIWFSTADAGRAWVGAVGQRAVIEIVP